jgi:autotransporter-associated beta strand protein
MTVYGTMTGGAQWLFTSTNGSVFYLGGSGTSGSGTTHVNADVRITNGTYTSTGAFVIGRQRPAPQTQPLNATGTLTLDGPTTVFNQTADYISLGRDSVWNSTLIIQNGATLNDQTGTPSGNPGIGLPRPGSTGNNNQSWLKMYGGTLNMGSGSGTAQPISLQDGGGRPGQISVLTQTGGVINAWGGIQLGGAGTFTGGSAMVTNSGGFLYIGSVGGAGIRFGTGVPLTDNISLSGGTVGALQSWISSVPMTLATLNGNITFQCADASTSPFNISLSGALTGPGGFNKTGGGVLTLTGTNNFAGTTAVSNGTLVVSTVNLPKSGDVIVDGSGAAAGLPVVSNLVANAGQSWTMTNLTFAAGTPTLSFNYGALSPSTTVAPIQAKGNLAFTVTPTIVVDGTAIPTGTYPLIQYTGTLSGTPPTTIVSLPPSATSANIVNNTANKSIDLHIISTVSPALTWAVGDGNWDTTTSNWKQFGVSAKYTDDGTKDVLFDDTATGTSPITVTLNTTLNNPHSVTANNATKSYIVAGTGVIGGTGTMTVSGGGSLTLSNANTYSGGTTVTAPGQLSINYGGSGGADSAIGTGALNLNTGAKIDNTSGHAIVLNTATPIPINWIGDWTFVGSTNFDLGHGQVTLGNVSVVLTVVSNTLTVNNLITDNGQNYQLVKQGNGTLTLSNANTFAGGMQLNAGTLNINADGAVGTGRFDINGGTLDNTSGSTVALSGTQPSLMNWSGSITFKGTTNLDLGAASVNVAATTLTLQSNTLMTEGGLDGHNGPGVTNNGTGIWTIGGSTSDNALNMTINGGTVNFNKGSGARAVAGNTTTVNTNGTLVMLGVTGTQMGPTTTLVLGGGTVEMNGDSETIQTVTFNSGTLRNSTPTTTAALAATAGVTLVSSNCVFNVTAADSILAINGAVSGSGGLVKTGAGLLNLDTNSYSGNTVISNGTLAIIGTSPLTNSLVIDIVATNSVLDVSQAAGGTLVLSGSQTVQGNGQINGSLTAGAGTTVSPGEAGAGILSVTNNITLAGTTAMDINKVGGTNDLLSSGATLTYGGTLSVTINGTLAGGDTFKLFNATNYAGAFATVSPAIPGVGLTWNTNNLAVNGTLAVSSASVPLPPHLGPITLSGGTNLTISGTGGAPNGTYSVLTSLTVTNHLTNWTVVGTSNFDGSGNFTFTGTVSGTNKQQFFIFQAP